MKGKHHGARPYPPRSQRPGRLFYSKRRNGRSSIGFDVVGRYSGVAAARLGGIIGSATHGNGVAKAGRSRRAPRGSTTTDRQRPTVPDVIADYEKILVAF